MAIQLTPREQQIFVLLTTRALSNKQIANHLNVTESTIKAHMSKIMAKYGAKTRTQLVLFTQRA
jgi:DNA-binding NarL/FixJ family response regulator